MLGSAARRMLVLALAAVRSVSAVALIGLLGALTGCWDGTSTVQSVSTIQQLESISLSPPDTSLAPGLTQQLTATGIYSDGSKQNISSSVAWTSSRSAVAAISGSGTATGLSSGSTTITAAAGGITGTTALNVTAAHLVSIGITPAAPSIALGTTQTLIATGVYSDNSTHDVTDAVSWESETPAVAAVSSAGMASGTTVGQTLITATLGGVTSPGVTLKVTAATLVSIGVTPGTRSIALGTGEQFTATGIYTDNSTQNLTTAAIWISSSTSVASISNASGSNGLAASLGVGSTTITALVGSVASGPVTLTVTPATLVSIGVTPGAPSIALGTGEQFTATGIYTDNSTQNLTTAATWNSSVTSVASISNASGSNGLAASLSAGSTTITAVVGSVTSGPVTLTVTPATLVSIGVTSGAASIALGTGEQFTATGTYTDNSSQDLTTAATWVALPTTVASISNAAGSNGLATALAVGSTMITAVSGSITSNPVTLTVSAATLVSIAITPTAPSIGFGAQQQLTATGTYTDNSTQDLTTQVVWASNNGVATISNASGTEGVASSVAIGTALISATLGSVTATPITLTVTSATVASIFMVHPPLTWQLGGSLPPQFDAEALYTDNSTQNVTNLVTWTSSDTTVATISNAAGSNGVATALTAGSTIITATLDSETANTTLMVIP
jgi:trimeric autotransporter adhesin